MTECVSGGMARESLAAEEAFKQRPGGWGVRAGAAGASQGQRRTPQTPAGTSVVL